MWICTLHPRAKSVHDALAPNAAIEQIHSFQGHFCQMFVADLWIVKPMCKSLWISADFTNVK